MRLSRAPESFQDLEELVGSRSGRSATNQINRLNRDVVHHIIVNDFRAGRLGRITLDNIPSMRKALNLDNSSTESRKEESKESTRIPEEQEVVPCQSNDAQNGFDDSWGPDMKDALSKVRNFSETISRRKGPISKCLPQFKIRNTV